MKTVKFYKNGTSVRIFDYDDKQVVDKLPPSVYTICQDISGFYLSLVSDRFDVPDKIYGSTQARVKKIMATYDDRTRSTGVLMSGDKGSGKTMLSSLLCNNMVDRGLPIILVERAYEGPNFVEFLNNIGECALFFDEFAKVFSKASDNDSENDAQNGLLSVFDGANTIKRLILLTENETYNISSFMLNRPGRIYYHFKYSKLEESLVREYCEDNSIPENVIQTILLRIDSSREFSFDALKAVVEEYLRFGEDVMDIFSNLNIEEPRSYAAKMKVVKIINTQTQEEYRIIQKEVNQPTKDHVWLRYGIGDDDDSSVRVSVKDLVERDGNKQIYDVKNMNIIVVLEKQEEEDFSGYSRYFAV